MTSNQKYIIELLFSGSFITQHNGRYRLLDKACNPQLAFTEKTITGFKNLLRKQKGVQVINLKAVRAMRDNCWVKQLYKQQQLKKPKYIICDIKKVPVNGIIQFPDDATDYFIREQFDNEAKAVRIGNYVKLFFVKHGTEVIYFKNKKLN
jgi:hypothetical protein